MMFTPHLLPDPKTSFDPSMVVQELMNPQLQQNGKTGTKSR